MEHPRHTEPQPQWMREIPRLRQPKRFHLHDAGEPPQPQTEAEGRVTYTERERQDNASTMRGAQSPLASLAQLGLAPAPESFVASPQPARERGARHRDDESPQYAHQRARFANQEERLARDQRERQRGAHHATGGVVLGRARADRLRAHREDLEHDADIERRRKIAPPESEDRGSDEWVRQKRLPDRRGGERGHAAEQDRSQIDEIPAGTSAARSARTRNATRHSP